VFIFLQRATQNQGGPILSMLNQGGNKLSATGNASSSGVLPVTLGTLAAQNAQAPVFCFFGN